MSTLQLRNCAQTFEFKKQNKTKNGVGKKKNKTRNPTRNYLALFSTFNEFQLDFVDF
jgi:hypothetical protein